LDKKIVNALIKDYDISFIVRKELIAALFNYINQFIVNQPTNPATSNQNNITQHQTLLKNSDNSSGISSMNSNNSLTAEISKITLSKSQSSSTLSQQQQQQPNQQSSAKINTIQENSSHQTNTPNFTPKLAHSVSINQGLNSFNFQSPGFFSAQSTINANSSLTSPINTLSSTKRERLISQPSSGQANNSMPIKPSTGSPVASILPYSNKSVYSIFNRVWNLLVEMQNDPYPDVAEFAHKVVTYFSVRAQSFDMLKRNMILQHGLHSIRRFSNDLTNKPSEKIKDEEDSIISTEYVQW